MCTRADCQKYVGQYVRFRSPFGYHEGVIEHVRGDKAIILSPRQYIPVQLASTPLEADDAKRLDLALAWGGVGGGFGGYGGGHPGGAYGRGYGGWAGYGWGRWAVAFLSIYLLWGLVW